MLLRSAGIVMLLVFAACAARPEQPVRSTGAGASGGIPGTILAMRPVPPGAPVPVQTLLSATDAAAAPGGPPIFEYIVRTETGTTLAIVQPQAAHLHPGERVSIRQGPPPRIDADATN